MDKTRLVGHWIIYEMRIGFATTSVCTLIFSFMRYHQNMEELQARNSCMEDTRAASVGSEDKFGQGFGDRPRWSFSNGQDANNNITWREYCTIRRIGARGGSISNVLLKWRFTGVAW